ncbi:MAG: HAD family hydrolase [Myxococcota bacterium]
MSAEFSEEAGAAGGEVVAFFDMDLTIVGANTGKLWIRDAFARGEVGVLTMARLMFAVARYRLGVMDPGPLMTQAVRTLDGVREDAFALRSRRFFDKSVRPHILPLAVDCIRDHEAQGHGIALLSASTNYVVGPLANHLGLEHALCTRLHVVDGQLTGGIVEPLCYGVGKLAIAREFADARGVRLEDAWFYTDSIHDLAVLEAVGNPVAVNPDPRLERIARRRGWQVLDFFGRQPSRSRVNVADLKGKFGGGGAA